MCQAVFLTSVIGMLRHEWFWSWYIFGSGRNLRWRRRCVVSINHTRTARVLACSIRSYVIIYSRSTFSSQPVNVCKQESLHFNELGTIKRLCHNFLKKDLLIFFLRFFFFFCSPFFFPPSSSLHKARPSGPLWAVPERWAELRKEMICLLRA